MWKNALLLASSQGNSNEVTQIINEHGVFIIDIHFGDGLFSELTPLTVAAKYGHTECARTILQLGGDLYSMGYFNGVYYVTIANDYTAAIVNAAANDHIECVLMLVEFRFFPYSLDERDTSYAKLIAAAKEGDYLCIESLLDTLEDKVNVIKGWKGHNVMNMCLLRGCHPSFLKIMIDHGVGVNGWDFNGLTPLMCAILGKNLECVQYLLHQDADIKATDVRQCSHFHEDFTVHISDDLMNRYNRTALMYAACIGDINILKTLLPYVALEDINRQEAAQGYFPLLYAIMSGKKEVVSFLLENGAEVNMSNFDRRGPLCFSVRYCHADLFDIFLDKTSIDEKFEAAMECVYLKNVQYLERLIKSCDGAICQNEYEGQLLEEAATCSDDSTECAQFLIENGYTGADVFLNKSRTALICSSRDGRDKIVEFLIKFGANLNITDAEGMSAVREAAQNSHFKCLQLLLDAGADLDIVDKQGGTIFCDIITGDIVCLEMLLKSGIFLQCGKLKNVHINAVKSLGVDVKFPLKNVLLLMRSDIFEWDWSLQAGYLNIIAFAAVLEGYSPSKCIHYEDQCISLAHLALIRQDLYTVRYILANLYFLPEDFKILTSDRAKSVLGIPEDVRGASLSLMDQISSQPLSLQTWSFLIISRALSCNREGSNDRTKKVKSLPLPEGIKKKLQFQNAFSPLCSIQWGKIDAEAVTDANENNLCNLIMDKKSFLKNPLVNCSSECQLCFGLGKIIMTS